MAATARAKIRTLETLCVCVRACVRVRVRNRACTCACACVCSGSASTSAVYSECKTSGAKRPKENTNLRREAPAAESVWACATCVRVCDSGSLQ